MIYDLIKTDNESHSCGLQSSARRSPGALRPRLVAVATLLLVPLILASSQLLGAFGKDSLSAQWPLCPFVCLFSAHLWADSPEAQVQ